MTDINENTTVEQNVEMNAGEMLRNARTTGRRKREIPTIAKQLCIREEFLQALEDGNYAVIPETVYILGFARNYAMELGLNPDEIVAKIKQEMGLVAEGAPAKGDAENDVAAKSAAVRSGAFARIWNVARRHWIMVASAVAALVALIVLAVLLIGGGATNAEDAPGTIAPVVAADTVAEPKYAVDVRERFGVENRANARVILQAIQESWVKIEDARGNTVFSRVLVPGDVYYVPGASNHKATFGNAGGIDIWLDGVLAEKAGPAHTRKNGISLAPDSLKPAVAQTE